MSIYAALPALLQNDSDRSLDAGALIYRMWTPMMPREGTEGVNLQQRTTRLYTQRPHDFQRLGPKSITCIHCGNVKNHPLHTEYDHGEKVKKA